ncbi:hypothetical protein DEJ50_31905 [Streptomyces venezuelae]|uniref:Tat pathway signal sequence domain protein n=1 Tax=Streptomyces venezuelae TaxID=54571 RepID=A0A5P2D9M4_STRVZ|nr:hypothetical protein [Streptomyces venezuelae]QES51776.1 hypothetical protein DEJ50_31905 [Streptomyces venezuelae]
MSGISRRSLLGYSGTAAAGAALAAAGTAQAADGTAVQAGAAASSAAQGSQSAPVFPSGTQFKGSTALPGGEGELQITFSVSVVDAPGSYVVPPIEVANALNALAQTHGWSPVTFYGTPAPAPLTS